MTSEEIIAMREKLGLSRKQLVQLIDVPYETLCRWEKGKRSPSKFYEAQLRRLTGEVEFQKLKQEWIFLAPNIQRVKNVVSTNDTMMFGTIHALFDENETIFLATIHLRPDARTLKDLKEDYIQNQDTVSGNERKRVLGFFVAVDKETRPSCHMLMFMKESAMFEGGYCVIYSKAEDNIVVWKYCAREPLDPRSDSLRPIPYLILGNRASHLFLGK